jgi:hypothetical protein
LVFVRVAGSIGVAERRGFKWTNPRLPFINHCIFEALQQIPPELPRSLPAGSRRR